MNDLSVDAFSAAEENLPPARTDVPAQRTPIDSVLLIDGDNDPHIPPDAPLGPCSLIRVFLRPGAKMPRNLEKSLGHLPHCATVVSPRGGANAADFVMSLHAGMLHATLPHHIPFLLVTNDATLQAMAAELQRLGRVATLWTSHPDAAARAAVAEAGARTEPTSPRRRRSGRAPSRRGGRRVTKSRAATTPVAPAPAPTPISDAPRKVGGKTLSEVAWSYASRLQRIKDVPSRLKTLLNDIKNRAGSHGFHPEEILQELKNHHGVAVDGQGRVKVEKTKPAGAGPSDAPEIGAS